MTRSRNKKNALKKVLIKCLSNKQFRKVLLDIILLIAKYLTRTED